MGRDRIEAVSQNDHFRLVRARPTDHMNGRDSWSEPDMQALEDTIAALGRPVFVRALGTSSEPTAAIARWRHGPGVVEVAPSHTIRLAMSLMDGRNARSRSGGFTDRGQGGSVSIFAPMEGACVEVSGEADVVQLFLDQSFAEATIDAPFACPPMFDLCDDGMRTMIMRVLVGSARRGPDDALMVEQDLNALALRIARHASQGRRGIEPSAALFRGGLAPAAFRRVEAMTETALDLAGSPTLTEMATAAGLSVTQFVRAFRRHTGSTPHQYLIRRRMDRAVSRLRVAKLSVAEVADAVGFSTPAHFVASFRTVMGVTPGALREALAGNFGEFNDSPLNELWQNTLERMPAVQ
jgi:AraC family transcriptional regulator